MKRPSMWRGAQETVFIVTEGGARAQALEAMERGLERERISPLLPESAAYLSDAWNTLRVMRQAPVIIFIVNTLGEDIDKKLTIDERVSEICNAQSIGAAIENMALAATELGLGSLWICNTYFAYTELRSWIGTDGELFAALAIGYADEAPKARPRKAAGDVVEWRKSE